MGHLQVSFSNRIENLLDNLAQVILQPQESVDFLAAETVLLDNKVLGGWINLQLAQQHSIAANIQYVQPSSLFWTMAKSLLGDSLPRETPLLKDEMQWRLFSLLGDQELLNKKVMIPVKNYLVDEKNKQLKRYQLAASIADLFDQYLIFRADWLLSWEEFPDKNVTVDNNEQWQKILWRELATTKTGHDKPLIHRAAIERKLLEMLSGNDTETIKNKLTIQRLFVFGMTTMPPSMLQLLQMLGKHIPIYLYVLNPCQEFWFDCKSPKEWLRGKQRKVERDNALVIGNPLLLSNGQQVREFIEKIVADEGFDYQVEEEYLMPNSDTILHCIQQDILSLTQAGEIASLSPQIARQRSKRSVPDNEFKTHHVPSVHIHSCHSPMREVEVLRDQLLDMMTKDATLMPRDIVVMMPQSGKYMPYIEAVFANAAEYLPYHITDLSMVEESPLLGSIDILLGLPNSRLKLSEILAILAVPAVQRKFDLNRDSYEQLKEILINSGARWGIDAQHRQKVGLPEYSEFSWEFAINRLLSGFSMSAQSNDNINVVLAMGEGELAVSPLDEIEGGGSELLNSFLQFWQTILYYRQQLQGSYSALAWSEIITAMFDSFFKIEDDDDELRAMREIRQQLQILRKASNEQWICDDVDLSVIRDFIKTVLKGSVSKAHQWREGVKFCSLMPMRGVPFRIVYMLGMNQGEYPGRVEKKSFDLMRNHVRYGDRSRRVDDRWLFLEALLSARDYLHISYVGHDQRKNDERQPSVLVAELLDYLRDGYDAPIENYITQHPLQPFSKNYFQTDKNSVASGENKRLISYNAQAYAIASASSNGSKLADNAQSSMHLWPASKESVETLDVELNDFIRFFTEPAKWFFNNKHKTYLSIEDTRIDDEEIFSMDGLDSWQARESIKTMSLHHALIDKETIEKMVDSLKCAWQAKGHWPLGSQGENFTAELKNDIAIEWLEAAKLAVAAQILSVDKTIKTESGNLRIKGSVSIFENIIIEHFSSAKKGKYSLGFYLRSALVALCDDSIHAAQAVFFKKKSMETVSLQWGEEVDFQCHFDFLTQCAELYLQYREHGLPFTPDLSYDIFEAIQNDASTEEIIDKAWEGDFNFSGLKSDINSRAYYMNIDRLYDNSFANVSVLMWQTIGNWLVCVELIAEDSKSAEIKGEV